MDQLPLHPGLVHLPLGIAFAAPLLALAVSFAIIRAWLPRAAWALIVGLLALQLGTGIATKQAGEAEEDRVGKSMPKGAIHEHEEAAEAFVIATGVALLLAAGVLALRKDAAFRAATMAVALGLFAPLVLGLQAGRLGGELVYVHGVPTVGAAPLPAAGGGGEAQQHDDGD